MTATKKLMTETLKSGGAATAYGNGKPTFANIASDLIPDEDLSAEQKTFLSHVDQKLDLINKEKGIDKARRSSLAFTKRALQAYQRFNFDSAFKHAQKAVEANPKNALAYYALALSYEIRGDLHLALETYEKTLALDPSETKVYFQLGNIAHKLDMIEAAKKFYSLHINGAPDDTAGYVNLAAVYREKDQFDEAVDILKLGISRMPEEPALWNMLGTTAHDFLKIDEAKIFLEEAIRLDPKFARGYYNLGFLLNHTGPWDQSLDYHNKGLKLTSKNNPDWYEIINGRALCHFMLGNVSDGFEDWEVRHNPKYSDSLLYAIDADLWQGEDIKGKKLLIVGEQGVGDELMFAHALSEVVEDIGPDGQLMVACDERLVPLYERSFPSAQVGPHSLGQFKGKPVRLAPWATGELKADYYCPIGSSLRFYRKTAEDFTPKRLFTPDPTRVEYWKTALDALGDQPKVGICWRSMLMNVKRRKYFSPIDLWEPILRTPDIQFINIQYGDVADDIKDMQDRFGVEVHDFEEINLRDDLDDNAALCAALDLVISAPTAAAAIAGTVGTETWLPLINRVWPQFGRDDYPLYANARCFRPAEHADWPDVMGGIAVALATYSVSKSVDRTPAVA